MSPAVFDTRENGGHINKKNSRPTFTNLVNTDIASGEYCILFGTGWQKSSTRSSVPP